MKMDELRTLAKTMGLTPGKSNKTSLVRSIQAQEGNFDCFATAANGDCDQQGCVWRKDCFTIAHKQVLATKH